MRSFNTFSLHKLLVTLIYLLITILSLKFNNFFTYEGIRQPKWIRIAEVKLIYDRKESIKLIILEFSEVGGALSLYYSKKGQNSEFAAAQILEERK